MHIHTTSATKPTKRNERDTSGTNDVLRYENQRPNDAKKGRYCQYLPTDEINAPTAESATDRARPVAGDAQQADENMDMGLGRVRLPEHAATDRESDESGGVPWRAWNNDGEEESRS